MTSKFDWLDEEQTSVLVLDPQADPHHGARLVVALEDDGTWRGFAVTPAHPILAFGSAVDTREKAKASLLKEVLRSLHEDAARPGHGELMAFQPVIEAASRE